MESRAIFQLGLETEHTVGQAAYGTEGGKWQASGGSLRAPRDLGAGGNLPIRQSVPCQYVDGDRRHVMHFSSALQG